MRLKGEKFKSPNFHTSQFYKTSKLLNSLFDLQRFEKSVVIRFWWLLLDLKLMVIQSNLAVIAFHCSVDTQLTITSYSVNSQLLFSWYVLSFLSVWPQLILRLNLVHTQVELSSYSDRTWFILRLNSVHAQVELSSLSGWTQFILS